MGRKKAVFSADPTSLAEVESLVKEGRYSTVSEFVREAMAEKLVRLRRARLHEQVARYCRGADMEEGDDLIGHQAFPADDEK